MSRIRRYVVPMAVLGTMAMVLMAPVARAQDFMTLPVQEIIAQAENVPPVGLYMLAGRLFSAGRRDEAVTWFYIAQIRSRFRLAAVPDLPPDGEPAVYASLNDNYGTMINGWAFGDVDAAAGHMTQALDWDASHPNATTPKAEHAEALQTIRNGLVALRTKVLATKDEIRRDRLTNGLTNR